MTQIHDNTEATRRPPQEQSADAGLLTPSQELELAQEFRSACVALRAEALASPLAPAVISELNSDVQRGELPANDGAFPDFTGKQSEPGAVRHCFEQVARVEMERAESSGRQARDQLRGTQLEALQQLEAPPWLVACILARIEAVAGCAEQCAPLSCRLFRALNCDRRGLRSKLNRARSQARRSNSTQNELPLDANQLQELSEQVAAEGKALSALSREYGVAVDGVVASHGRVRTLWRQMERARDDMVQANLRLVTWVARKYMDKGLSLADLIQEGNFGLLRAVERFEPDRGLRFSTYARWWIRQAVQRAVANQGRTIRTPVHMLAFQRHVLTARSQFANRCGRDPTPRELADQLAMPLEKVDKALQIAPEPKSLQASVGSKLGDEGAPLQDFIEDSNSPRLDEQVSMQDDAAELSSLLSTLSPRERQVLTLRFGLDARRDENTLQEIGDELGVSRERVRQIERQALQKLRRAAGRRGQSALFPSN